MLASLGFLFDHSPRIFHDGWFFAGIPFAILFAAVVPYFIPSIIAFLRRHESAAPASPRCPITPRPACAVRWAGRWHWIWTA